MDKCGILYPRTEIDDESGCINDDCNGEHICLDTNGVKWHWKEDDNCTCGCWDEMAETGETPSLVYWQE